MHYIILVTGERRVLYPRAMLQKFYIFPSVTHEDLRYPGYDMVRYGVVWSGTVWYGTVWLGEVRYGTVRYGTVWSGTVRSGKVRFGFTKDIW